MTDSILNKESLKQIAEIKGYAELHPVQVDDKGIPFSSLNQKKRTYNLKSGYNLLYTVENQKAGRMARLVVMHKHLVGAMDLADIRELLGAFDSPGLEHCIHYRHPHAPMSVFVWPIRSQFSA